MTNHASFVGPLTGTDPENVDVVDDDVGDDDVAAVVAAVVAVVVAADIAAEEFANVMVGVAG